MPFAKLKFRIAIGKGHKNSYMIWVKLAWFKKHKRKKMNPFNLTDSLVDVVYFSSTFVAIKTIAAINSTAKIMYNALINSASNKAPPNRGPNNPPIP